MGEEIKHVSGMTKRRSSFSFGFISSNLSVYYGTADLGAVNGSNKVKEGWLIKVDSLPLKVDFSEHGQMQTFFFQEQTRTKRNRIERCSSVRTWGSWCC